jgi:magnesium transporter
LLSREIKTENFLWIDISSPTTADLEKIGKQFHLDPSTIHDCLEPEHLPKLESLNDVHFVILRSYDFEADKKSDSVQTITNKVALFVSATFLITISRQEQVFVRELFDKTLTESKEKTHSTYALANEIMYRVTKTYEVGLLSVYKTFDSFEQDVFNKSKKLKLVQSYLLKRRINIMRRVLSLMKEPIIGLMAVAPPKCRLDYKNTKDFIDKMTYQADVVHDNLVSLLSLQISLASQVTNEASHRTNEVMRTLTIVSIFFMPLNFIAGVYGMNFESMPFLKSTIGFWLILLLMLGSTTFIYRWLHQKGWLHSKDL